ncbi:nuclear receptor subfamily 2 group E member 1 [Trichogramma pretiosum]|uniref:nuclear receptor subfamily 2 group E member 1 n=1 Tax=Trichogramma pretiosum TaxID=7493 RepID=UPI000C7194C8|nr:nuclear receptor subfamily 2 group E member 1 [Trichogramma pretiosum]
MNIPSYLLNIISGYFQMTLPRPSFSSTSSSSALRQPTTKPKLLIIGRRRIDTITVTVQGCRIISVPYIEYLGLHIDAMVSNAKLTIVERIHAKREHGPRNGHPGRRHPALRLPCSSSSRILVDVPCEVCADHSSGKHYGIYTCDGCAGFFKRSIRRGQGYSCKSRELCIVDRTHRNQCRACRLSKCLAAGMNKDSVQHERGPRNSTLRKQVALLYGSSPYDRSSSHPRRSSVPPAPPAPLPPTLAAPVALNLALPKPVVSEPLIPSSVATTPVLHNSRSSFYPVLDFSPKMSPSPPMLHQPLFRLPLILDTVNEQAARLIFNNVHFVRDINAQTKLCFEDQLTVLEASWRDLFLIGASQMYPLMDPAEMGGITPDLVVQCIRFRDIISEFHNLQLSSEQYSIVKAVVLYRAGLDYDSEISSSPSSNGSGSPLSTGRLKDPRQVARLKMDAESMLWANIRLTSPTLCEIKLSRIAYLIPLLQLVSRKSIEDFFFRKAIGDTRIEKVITDIYVRSLNQR